MLKMTREETKGAAKALIEEISRLAGQETVRLMEVCGTHTVAIFKAGIRQVLPLNVELVSGPGCPVCVTPNEYLDKAVALSRRDDVIIATFGDMLKVPGSSSSLAREKTAGADIRIVYSPLESLDIAKNSPEKKVIFLAVGFETTAPLAAATVLMAEAAGLENFYVLSAHKLVPPALSALLQGGSQVDGFLLPGHVSAIIGLDPYEFLAHEHQVPAVVAGFEGLDILQAVAMLLRQRQDKRACVENQYSRVVPSGGNPVACSTLYKVYEPADTAWRGIGRLPASGLRLRPEYERFDAEKLAAAQEETREQPGCRCGDILKGAIKPADCPLFAKACTPEYPVGACMVSVEGTCAAWYKYGAGRWQA